MKTHHELHARRMRERPTRLSKVVPPATVRAIIRAAGYKFAVPPCYIRDGRQRSNHAVAARRQIARDLSALGYSTTQIGRWLGGLHHTSVLYMLKDHPERKQRGIVQGAATPGQHEAEDIDPTVVDEWI